MESREAVITIGQNWRVRPEIYDAFIKFRHAYSYSRTTDALQHCLVLALTISGFLHDQQIREVGKRVEFDRETERRLAAAERHGKSRAESLAIMLRIGGRHFEAMGFEDSLVEEEVERLRA